jgi:hypothetical protein
MMYRSRTYTSYSMLDESSGEKGKKDYSGPSSGNALEDGFTREARAPRQSGKGSMSLDRADAFDEMRGFRTALGGSARSRVRSMIEDDDFFHPW